MQFFPVIHIAVVWALEGVGLRTEIVIMYGRQNPAENITRAFSPSQHDPGRSGDDCKARYGDIVWNFSQGKSAAKAGKPPLEAIASGGKMSEKKSSYILLPPSSRDRCNAVERASYFSGLLQERELDANGNLPRSRQAKTMLDLMVIRAFHSKTLRLYSLGSALGFRTRNGNMTDIPAIIVFVGRKVHSHWLLEFQKLPTTLQGPGGIWCDLDVMEFSYYGSPPLSPKEQLYTELVEALRGSDSTIGSGSQVASQETYGTLGCIVRSLTPEHKLGFLTNRHVSVDLDHPHQKMFHPLPPNLGPGVYLGSVERATSFITDDLWYGAFAGLNEETFIRADGAFIPFAGTFDLRKVTTDLKGVGEMGEIMRVDLKAPIGSIMGQHVMKVGRSSGITRGVIRAYAVDYNDGKGICYLTDFLVVGDDQQPFDSIGDSGSLILLTGEGHEKPRPLGIIWGGTANHGHLKLCNGRSPQNWTSCVDLGRLLDLLQLELINTQSRLQDAIEEHWQIHQRIQKTEFEGNGNSESETRMLMWEYEDCSDLERSPTYAPPEEIANLRRTGRRSNPPYASTSRCPVHDVKASPFPRPPCAEKTSSRPPCAEKNPLYYLPEVPPKAYQQRGKEIKEGGEELELDRPDHEGKRKRLFG